MRFIAAVAVLVFACLPAFGITATLKGTSYTLNAHPRGLLNSTLDARIKDPDGAGASVAPKAVAGNPAWDKLTTDVTAGLLVYNTTAGRANQETGYLAYEFAMYWYADNSQTAAKTAALYMLNHIEYYVPLVCVETINECVDNTSGYGITSYGAAYWAKNWSMAFELMQGQMTSGERATFAGKILNDHSTWGGINGASGTSCTNPTTATGGTMSISNPTYTQAGGTLTGLSVSSGVITVTVSTSVSGMPTGSQIVRVTRLPDVDNFYDIFTVGTNSFTAGYTGLADGSYLSGATVTVLAPYATSSTAVFGSTVAAGDYVWAPTEAYNVGYVTGIVDSTHAFLAGPPNLKTPHSADTMYYRAKDWSAGQCGYIWHIKHDYWTPTSIISPVSYGPGGNGGTSGNSAHNLVYSAAWGVNLLLLATADDDPNYASRTSPQLTALYNLWYDYIYDYARSFATGFHQSGNAYGQVRYTQFMPGFSLAIMNSFASAPNLMGAWSKNLMTMFYANTFPNAQRAQMHWGQESVSGGFGNGMSGDALEGFVMLADYYKSTDEGKYANWWLRNIWGNEGVGYGTTPGTNLGFVASNLKSESPPWFFLYTDSADTTVSLTSAPTTFVWNQTQTGTTQTQADAMISRTGYTSATDTLVNFHAEYIGFCDHNISCHQPSNSGSYKIFKGHYLLAERSNFNTSDPKDYGYTSGGDAANTVQIGGTEANMVGDAVNAFPIYAGLPRGAGDTTYAYAMADFAGAYYSSALLTSGGHAYRHLVDFKKSGTQQFLVEYTDVRTTAGAAKKMFYHYPNKATTSLSTDVVTTNNSNGNTSMMLTKVLQPQQVKINLNTSDADAALEVCPSTNGTTCDSTNTLASTMVVHMPLAGSSGSLPTLSLLSTISTNFHGVDIGGTSPKVAVFGKDGSAYSSCTFTTLYGGQILVAGLSPGTYYVTKNGSTVLTNQVVTSASNALEFDDGAGAYAIAQGTPPGGGGGGSVLYLPWKLP